MKIGFKTLIFISILIVTACGTSKNRKCNGKKAIQTPMGKM